jgi:hypothetical protein
MDNSIDLEKYTQAVNSAISKAYLRADDSIEISDIWIITSLPMDLIMECLNSPDVKLPSNVSKLVLNKKVILKNPNYIANPGNSTKEE